MDFDLLKSQILKVNMAFYDRVYKDPWLSQVFKNVPQEHIERQQTEFMLGAFGGPKLYQGRSPTDAHPHINITEEMWALREQFLKEAFIETGFSEVLSSKWIKIDEAFKPKILKSSVKECKGRFASDEIIDIPNPIYQNVSHRLKKAA